jgi:glutamate 5-kinase
MAIVNGQSPHVLLDLLDGKPVGTLFSWGCGVVNLNARQLWIMYQNLVKKAASLSMPVCAKSLASS